ncbi:MAG: MATE family efflux transporter [Clostridia bacterium]|nr:MATE family efflux transporter [Clostridia bacterium]
MGLRRYIGTKDFYKRFLKIAFPIMVQNGITNFVNMLDNIMVGSIGTAEMSGVAVTNQLIFVFNLCIFGAVSGAGIFSAQYAGKNDTKGLRYTFRFKFILCVLFSALAIVVFVLGGDTLINLYLKGEGTVGQAAASFAAAKKYMLIMLIGFIPYGITQSYASVLRATGKTVLPMAAGLAAVTVNLAGNYILIFGHFGAPKLGVAGAAIATVISRFVEMLIVIIYTAVRKRENEFIIGAYKSPYVPWQLIRNISIKGFPLMINEALWAAGMATLNGFYSLRGLDVVAANNINQTFFNVFSVAYMAVGVSIGIVVGQMLGANKKDEAKNAVRQLMAFSLCISLVVASAFFLLAFWIPNIYNTTDSVRKIATGLMQVCAITMPIEAFIHSSYFTLRSGGKVAITFIFDCGYVWLIRVPFAAILIHFTGLPIIPLYFVCQIVDLSKVFLGYYLIKKGVWANKIVD